MGLQDGTKIESKEDSDSGEQPSRKSPFDTKEGLERDAPDQEEKQNRAEQAGAQPGGDDAIKADTDGEAAGSEPPVKKPRLEESASFSSSSSLSNRASSALSPSREVTVNGSAAEEAGETGQAVDAGEGGGNDAVEAGRAELLMSFPSVNPGSLKPPVQFKLRILASFPSATRNPAESAPSPAGEPAFTASLSHLLPLPKHLPVDQITAWDSERQVFASSSHSVIVKTVPWWADDELAELEKEAKNYDRLWRTMPELAEKVVVRFGGLYRNSENLLALVVERGESIREWKDIEDPQTLISLLSHFHQTGYIHADLAPRNIVKTSRGYRLIDLGRAFRARKIVRDAELGELRKVLDPETTKTFMTYSWAADF